MKKLPNRVNYPAFGPGTPGEEIALFVKQSLEHPEQKEFLCTLLAEHHPIYQDRSTNQAVRIKSVILASFSEGDTPEQALPYILDELANAHNANLVAAAARGLRGCVSSGPHLVPFLLEAMDNIRYREEFLSLDELYPEWPLVNPTTPLLELLRTLSWLGGAAKSALPVLQEWNLSAKELSQEVRAALMASIDVIEKAPEMNHSCCGFPEVQSRRSVDGLPRSVDAISTVRLEDQNGNTTTFAELVNGRPTVVSFFYTRCTNPNKCSLTITKLASLQKHLIEFDLQDKVNIAAITYDPEYDLPVRLKNFTANRGLVFTERVRAFRVEPDRFGEVRDFFELGVNYGDFTVNHHRIELFILSADGQLHSAYSRMKWEVNDVLEDVKKAITEAKGCCSHRK